MLRFWLSALTLFVLLFGLSAVLAVSAAYDPPLSLGAVQAVLLGVGVYMVAAYGIRTAGGASLAASLWTAAGLIVALYFIAQFGYQGYPDTPAIITRLGQLTTLPVNISIIYFHPNAAATFLEIPLPLAVALAIRARRPARRVLWSLVTLGMGYALLLTFSRGAWVALAAVAVLAGALRLPSKIRLGFVAAALIVGVGTLVTAVALGPERLPFLASTFEAASSRLALYRNTLYLTCDYLFTGIGPGDTFAMVYSRYGLLIFVPFLSYAHNLPLAVWLGQGLLGAAAFIGVFGAFFGLVYRVNRLGRADGVFTGAWLGVAATLLHGLTDARQYIESPWTMPLLFGTLGLTAALGRLALRDLPPATTTRVPTHPRLAVIVVLGTLIGIGLLLGSSTLRAAWLTNQGALAETRAELAPDLSDDARDALFDTAASLYQQALNFDPAYPSANRRLGNLEVARGNFDAAVPLLDAAVESESGNPAAVKGLGLAYVWVGRTDEAARLFLTLANPVGMANELYTWGRFRSEQDQPLLAAYAWEAAELLAPDSTNVAVWLDIAGFYAAAGDGDGARRWYTRVQDIDPDNQAAAAGLARLTP